MAFKAQLADGLNQICIVRCTVNIVATEASHTPFVHLALYKIIALHSIFVGRAIGEMHEIGFAELMFLELPEIFEICTLVKSYRPVVVLSLDWIL